MDMNRLKDIARPLDLKQVKRGWYETREYNYWIPEADIEGSIPAELYGTLLRNGPGLLEVYGKKLQHRKLVMIIRVDVHVFHVLSQVLLHGTGMGSEARWVGVE